MCGARKQSEDFGAYRVERTWMGCWRWRLAERLGGHGGFSPSRKAAMSAARQRLRALHRQREA